MNRSTRLPKTVKGSFTKRRLDFVTEKNEMIKDILELSGAHELDQLSADITGFGDTLSETLPALSLPRLRRIHSRLVLGERDIPVSEEF